MRMPATHLESSTGLFPPLSVQSAVRYGLQLNIKCGLKLQICRGAGWESATALLFDGMLSGASTSLILRCIPSRFARLESLSHEADRV
jgi:hypothetical protein